MQHIGCCTYILDAPFAHLPRNSCENENFLQAGAVTSMPGRNDVTWLKKNNLHALHMSEASLTQAFALAVALLW